LSDDGTGDLLKNSEDVASLLVWIFKNLLVQIVSDVKQSTCWASMVDGTTNIAALCCPFHLSQVGQSEDFQFCVVLKTSNKTSCFM